MLITINKELAVNNSLNLLSLAVPLGGGAHIGHWQMEILCDIGRQGDCGCACPDDERDIVFLHRPHGVVHKPFDHDVPGTWISRYPAGIDIDRAQYSGIVFEWLGRTDYNSPDIQ